VGSWFGERMVERVFEMFQGQVCKFKAGWAAAASPPLGWLLPT
ncbi:MAG: hypothetical protein RIS78_562, partial [Bacteroidota bacterium]